MKPETKKAISVAKIRIMSKPQTAFLTTVCASLPVEIDNSITYGATDGKTIYINEDNFMKLDIQQQMFLLAHETLHVIYFHALRREFRNPKRFNHACDYVINQQLVNQDFKMIKGGLLDSQYQGMSAEQVYRLLEDNEDNSGDNNPLDDDIDYQDGLSEEEQEQIENDVKNILISSAQTVEMQGKKDTIPPSIQRYLEDLVKPKVNWKVVLRRFMQALDAQDYTWRKPNKRYLPHDIYVPSLYSEGLSKITFAIDTSGSITKEQFNQFISEIHAVFKQFKPKVIDVMQFDHELQSHDSVKSLYDLRTIQFKGHGGTDPDVALEKFNETDSQGLIVITDGYFYKPQIEVKKPTIWCVFDNKDFQTPFGKTVHLEL